MRTSMIMQDNGSPIKDLIYIQSPLKCVILMLLCLFLLCNGLVGMEEENGRITVAQPTDEGKRNFALIIENHNWQSLNARVSSPDNGDNPPSISKKMMLEQFGYKEENIIYFSNGQASYEKLVAALSRLTDELKPEDNLFIYFLGECYFDAIFEKSYFFTSDFFTRNLAQQIHHSVFPDIARKSPYKLDAQDIGKWLEKLSVQDAYIVLNATNSSFFLSRMKDSLTNFPGNRAVHFFVLNHGDATENEEIDVIGNFHECFVGALRNALHQEVAEVPVALIEDAVGKCIGQVSDNTIISESCRSRAYKGKGFVFVRMMGTLEASLRADFKNITEKIEEKRNARELLKGDRAKYINELFSLKNKAEKHLKSEVFYQEIDAQIVHLGKEIKEIERIERDFEVIGCLAEEKRPMRYKKLYLSVTELSKKPEFASREMSNIEMEIWKKLIETFTIEYERLIVKLDNKKLHCLTKRKACKYFLSVFRDLKINDLMVAEITKKSMQYKCSFIEIDLSGSLSLISSNYNINLYDIEQGHLNIKVGHDLNTRILLLKSPLILIPYISYYRHLSGDSNGIIETLNNKELYFDAGRYQSWEAGFDLKWGGQVENFEFLYIFLGSGYRRNYFSIKCMKDRENDETVYFRELGNKKSFGCFTITTGLVLKLRSFAVTFGFPIFNGKTNSEYNYEIRDAPNTISLKPMHFQTKRRLWMGFAIYF
jgi:hypothetical protein